MQHFFSEKKIDKTTLPGRKAEYDIHFIRDHKQLQVPFFMETLKKALTFCPGVYNYNRFTEDCGDGPFVSVPLFMPVDKQGDRYKRTVPFFPQKDRPFFSLFFQESDKALFLETGICKKSNKASILFQAISFTLIPSTARKIII